jgi:hypothetical protein
MEIIIGLSITTAFWTVAAIVVIRSNKKLRSIRQQPRKHKPAMVRRFHPEVDRLLEMELN